MDGKDGKDGVNGQDGKDGDSIYWAVSEDGRKFVEFKNGVATGQEVEIPSAPGAITAVWDETTGTVTFYGVEGLEDGYVIGGFSDVVSAISLVDSYVSYDATMGFNLSQGYYVKQLRYGLVVYFSNVVEQENLFSKGIKNALTFEEGRQTPIGARFVVRVSPANYELKPEDITFVNSRGVIFDKIQAVNVEPFKGLLTKATTETGLWTVDVVLTEYNEKEFNAFSGIDTNKDGVNDNFISYAVKAQNAVSSYDLAFGYFDFAPSNFLNFYVGKNLETAEEIALLNNRYDDSSKSLQNPQAGDPLYDELTWKASTKKYPTPATAIDKEKKNVVTADWDNRSAENLYQAVIGEPISVFAGEWRSSMFEFNETIKGIYVTLDVEENAIESAPSEWNAWKLYEPKIEGLNEVFEGPMATICINDKRADGDVIGFRVYAVNLDGTLVDPDGRAFYVQVGEASTSGNAINTEMKTIEDFKNMKTPKVDAKFEKVAGADNYEFVMDDPKAPVFVVVIADKSGAETTLYGGATGSVPSTWKLSAATPEITKAYAIPTEPLFVYEDGKTYSSTLTVYNADGRKLYSRKITFTKTLPTSIKEVPVKTGQLGADGIYRCFLVPEQWTAFKDAKTAFEAGQFGRMDMLSIFNFPKDDPKGYEVTFANAKYTYEDESAPAWAERKKKDGSYVMEDITVVPTKTLAEDASLDAAENQLKVIDIDLIDNKTQHTTSVVYNMGPVSSELIVLNEDGSIKEVKDYTLDAGSFPTIFFCIYNNDKNFGWTWDWKITKAQYEALFPENKAEWKSVKSAPAIVYEDFDGKTIDPAFVDGKSLWDGKYIGTMPTGYYNTIEVKEVKLVTKTGPNAGKAEYYDVDKNFKFTKKSGATNPTAPVASTLVITYYDMYGHVETANMDAKVMPRK